MRSASPECNHYHREMLRRNELDAVQRGRLDVHLRLCAECRDLSDGLAMVEAGPGVIQPLSSERCQAIYSRLVPAVHEITNNKSQYDWVRSIPDRRSVYDWLRDVLDYRSRHDWFRGFTPATLSAAFVSAAVVLLGIALFRVIPTGSHNGLSMESEALLGQKVAQMSVEEQDPVESGVLRNGFIERLEGAISVDGADVNDQSTFRVKAGTRIAMNDNSRFSFGIDRMAKLAMFGKTQWQMTRTTETYLGIRLDRGRMAVDFDARSGKVMEISTPDSLIRVKGTVFTVEALPDGGTRVGVIEGLVEVISRRGEPRTVEVNGGQLVSFPGNGQTVALSDDQRVMAAEIDRMHGLASGDTRLVRFRGTPPDVRVELNGHDFGTAPLSVRLPVGPATYRLTSPGMEPLAGLIDGVKGNEEVVFSMEPIEDPDISNEDDNEKIKGHSHRRPTSSEANPSSVDSSKQEWGLLTRARDAMKEGDISGAIVLLEREVKRASGESLVTGLTLLAQCYLAAGKHEIAADTYDRVAAISPNSAAGQNARFEVGRVSLEKLGNLSRARASFSAYMSSPQGGSLKEEAHYSLCRIDGKEGKHKNALNCFSAFLREYPSGHNGPEARLWRGALYQDIERRWVDAEQDLKSFIQSRPRHPRVDEARYRMAIGRYQQGDKQGALSLINEYMEKHPNGRYRLRVERLKQAVIDTSASWPTATR